VDKILIIEDTTELRESIAEVLILENYSVIQASNGSMGIQLAQEHLPDLILCDIMMPEADGFQVLQSLKNEHNHLTIPFIFISALDERKNVREGMDLGADDYLIKPFSIEELLRAVKVRLDKHRSVESRIKMGIESIERELQNGISGLENEIVVQKSLLDKVTSEKEQIATQLKEKHEQLMRDALRTIEINTTLTQMSSQLTEALQKKGLTDEQHKILTELRNKLRNKSILLNNQTVFQLKFDQTHPEFKKNVLLKYPKLKKQDMVLLSSTFLQLDSNQLGIILSISPESVRKKRYRLKMKMGLGKDQELADFIRHLDPNELRN